MEANTSTLSSWTFIEHWGQIHLLLADTSVFSRWCWRSKELWQTGLLNHLKSQVWAGAGRGRETGGAACQEDPLKASAVTLFSKTVTPPDRLRLCPLHAPETDTWGPEQRICGGFQKEETAELPLSLCSSVGQVMMDWWVGTRWEKSWTSRTASVWWFKGLIWWKSCF